MAPADWQSQADRLSERSLAAGDPTGWFDQLWSQGRDGTISMPWDTGRAHPLLSDWAATRATAGAGRAGVVVGCGLGADAELVAGLGYRTVAFDVSETAIELARRRHPGSAVEYRQADLFALPPEWRRSFDLVVDIYTVQALPRDLRSATTAAVADLVAPGGTLLLVMAAQLPGDDLVSGPPWPLTADDIHSFGDTGLAATIVEQCPYDDGRPGFRWRAEFSR